METKDIRWEQRLSSYNKALARLSEIVLGLKVPEDTEDDDLLVILSELEMEGLIKRFEYTYELSWNVMKDYLEFQGIVDIKGPRDAIRGAFGIGLISHGEIWMDMIKSRQLTSHDYNEIAANTVFIKIIKSYFLEFVNFQHKMEGIRRGSQGNLFTTP